MRLQSAILLILLFGVMLTTGCCCCCSSSLGSDSPTNTTAIPTYGITKLPIATSTAVPDKILDTPSALKGNYTNDANYDKAGTPQNTLIRHMDALYKHDLNTLIGLRLPSWVKGQNNLYAKTGNVAVKPETIVNTMYEYETLYGYDVKGYETTEPGKVEARINVYTKYADIGDVVYQPYKLLLQEEGGKYYVTGYFGYPSSSPWT